MDKTQIKTQTTLNLNYEKKVLEIWPEWTEYIQKLIQKENLSYEDLKAIALFIRMLIVDMVAHAKSGHPGGALGLADIYTYLYFKHLKLELKNPFAENRDRLILSHGHVCAVRYSAMALKGILPLEELYTFRKIGSRLQGHPSTRYLPEAENSSGSLGQGLSTASGLALGLRLQKNPARVFVGISDGECQEGMTWEAAMAAAHYQLGNLTGFLDYNDIQIDGFVHNVMNVGNLAEKFRAFGWLVREASGHDFSAIEEAFHWANADREKPAMIVFRTTLGKGVSFMENNPGWHGKPPGEEDRVKALKELFSVAQKQMEKESI
ncbi:MAG: transketolase [Candidatus Hydrogenedentota bacterium]|nr:MAG: transketolase [Candidatus Hydrogenedentota bacterium]